MSTYEMRDAVGSAAHGYTPDEMSTGERTGAAKLKWVVIVDRSLSPGQAANAAVCVSAATAPIVKTCGSACHALLLARRVADHADLRTVLAVVKSWGRIRGGRTPGVQGR